MAIESFFDEHAKEMWDINWMNLKMHITLLNTYLPKLIATILRALREQLKDNDQLNVVGEIAGLVPQIPVEFEQIL